VGDGRAFTGRTGLNAEADCRSGGEEEDAVYHLSTFGVL